VPSYLNLDLMRHVLDHGDRTGTGTGTLSVSATQMRFDLAEASRW
jgi:thymidylate synthase